MSSYTAEQAAAANTTLRAALGLPPQQFSEEQFVGMISDEIAELHAAGKTDDEIACLLQVHAISIDAKSIARHFARR